MTFAILGAALSVLVLLERTERFRFRPAPFLRPFFATDVVYLLTGYVAGGSIAIAYIVAATHLLGTAGIPRVAAAGMPLWLAAPLALVLLDLGNYVAHWLLHRVDFLWEFHKVHHSSPRLDWLATFRSHIVEQALRRLVAPLFLIICGFSTEAVMLAGGLFYAWAAFNHSNLRPGLRLLESVVITPRLHRLHHLPRTTERNLGTLLTTWDRLRGTLVVAEADGGWCFGIPGEMTTYPQGWSRQLLEPARRCVTALRTAGHVPTGLAPGTRARQGDPVTRGVRLSLGLILLASPFARAACPPEALPAARAFVEAQCDCAGATHISSYVRCIARAAHRAARAGAIPRQCQGAIKKCASHSTCGRAGFFACCTSNSSGHTSCAIREGTKACHKQGSRGAACISPHASCCDACTASGCASPSGAFIDS